jgi:hypothetical protein
MIVPKAAGGYIDMRQTSAATLGHSECCRFFAAQRCPERFRGGDEFQSKIKLFRHSRESAGLSGE